ncbi:hypothetical protein DRJ17_04395 [Candidatus Woesearchaeota archaeon]|nr:MAG: hypothetical protein DRJ17_04395 [Candidatus Woesearchaeota archaeon]
MLGFVDYVLTLLYIITLFYTIFWLITIFDVKDYKKAKLKKKPNVSVVVPAYNEEKTIKETINSLLELEYPKDKLEIIVVNDGSTDKTKQIVRSIMENNKDRDIKLINQKNSGKYIALNRGLEIARGEFFICLDADSFIEKAGLKKMLPYFANKKVGAVLPLMKIKNPKNLLQKIQWYEYIINMFYKRIMGFLNCIHVAPGPFSMYRTSIIRKLGGFKKAHRTEDLEMALRLQRNHYKIVQLTNTVVYTTPPENLKSLYHQRVRWNKGSVLNSWDYRKIIFNKEYGDFGIFQMPIVISAGFIALTLVSMIIYYSVFKPSVKFIKAMLLTGFDLPAFFKGMFSNMHLLDFDYYKLVIVFVMLVIAAIVIISSHKFAKENIRKQGTLSLAVFILFYYILLGFIWLGITKELLLRKDMQWK